MGQNGPKSPYIGGTQWGGVPESSDTLDGFNMFSYVQKYDLGENRTRKLNE